MKRVLWLAMAAALAAAILVTTFGAGTPVRAQSRFNVIEASILDMQSAMRRGNVTSKQLVEIYLARIAQYEGTLNAVITVNPRARHEAEKLDAERAAGYVRSPLHGIPIAVKDILNTTDMPTTGGALAFAGFTPEYDSTVVAKLRQAGAIIIAKTTLTEIANWVASGMPGNYSAVGGFGLNPYDPRPDPRAGNDDGRPALGTGGSSSGTGTAANLWAANIGTETSGSILSPSNANMIAGIKPTVGLVSRWGIMPITADQDTAGPMARTVEDTAILLSAIAGRDSNDSPIGTYNCQPIPRDYTLFLRLSGLRGARIGIPRAFYFDPFPLPTGGPPSGGLNDAQRAVMNEAIEIMRREGAIIVDPANIPSVVDGTASRNARVFGACSGPGDRRGLDANCSVVLKYGFKRDFNAYVATFGADAPVKSLTALREFNLANRASNAIKYDQARLDISDEMDLVADAARYEADRARDIFLGGTHGIGEAMQVNNLDALVFPGSNGAGIAARVGYPTVIVPFGTIPNAPTNPPFPAGFNAPNARFGVSFTSTACNEPKLLEIAYAFEQATKRRVPPPLFP